MFLLIGPLAWLAKKLGEQRLPCRCLPLEEARSLTGLLLNDREILSLIIQDGPSVPWSDGHILAAAKLLQGKGRLIFVGSGAAAGRLGENPLISIARTEELAWELLARPAVSIPVRRNGGGMMKEEKRGLPELGSRQGQEARQPAAYIPRPLKLPPGRLLFIDVLGAQPRIGCTTQAIALWHYFHSLGMNPAVIVQEAQLFQLASTMEAQKKLPGELVIEGIPFITDAKRSYDCCIRDLGFSKPRRSGAAITVLTAGVKPWELEYTLQAVRSTRRVPGSAVILSFTEEEEAKKLGALFNPLPTAAAPYTPNPWAASAQGLFIYDTLLRPLLERQTEEETRCSDEPQKIL